MARIGISFFIPILYLLCLHCVARIVLRCLVSGYSANEKQLRSFGRERFLLELFFAEAKKSGGAQKPKSLENSTVLKAFYEFCSAFCCISFKPYAVIGRELFPLLHRASVPVTERRRCADNKGHKRTVNAVLQSMSVLMVFKIRGCAFLSEEKRSHGKAAPAVSQFERTAQPVFSGFVSRQYHSRSHKRSGGGANNSPRERQQIKCRRTRIESISIQCRGCALHQ